MKIIQGNIWDYQDVDEPICITTNGQTNSNNNLIMGKGIAYECKCRYPFSPSEFGLLVRLYGNWPFYLRQYNIISFPTKHHWRYDSDIDLIKNSALLIKNIFRLHDLMTIYSPWPGCSNGGLTKEQVRPVLEEIWHSDDFVIVEPEIKTNEH